MKTTAPTAPTRQPLLNPKSRPPGASALAQDAYLRAEECAAEMLRSHSRATGGDAPALGHRLWAEIRTERYDGVHSLDSAFQIPEISTPAAFVTSLLRELLAERERLRRDRALAAALGVEP